MRHLHDNVIEPALLPEEGYCQGCIGTWLQSNSTCPEDRNPLTLAALTNNRPLATVIQKLKVRCPNHDAAGLSGHARKRQNRRRGRPVARGPGQARLKTVSTTWKRSVHSKLLPARMPTAMKL